MEVALLQHQYDLIDLTVNCIQHRRIKKERNTISNKQIEYCVFDFTLLTLIYAGLTLPVSFS